MQAVTLMPGGAGLLELPEWNRLSGPRVKPWHFVVCRNLSQDAIDGGVLERKRVSGTRAKPWRVTVCRNLSQNAIGGSLPPEWGWERCFVQVVTLTLDGNRLSGQLPETYGRPGAWEALQALVVDNNQLTGAREFGSLRGVLN